MTKRDYRLVTRATVDELQEAVTKLQDQGWTVKNTDRPVAYHTPAGDRPAVIMVRPIQ